jgi:hypothetical protein
MSKYLAFYLVLLLANISVWWPALAMVELLENPWGLEALQREWEADVPWTMKDLPFLEDGSLVSKDGPSLQEDGHLALWPEEERFVGTETESEADYQEDDVAEAMQWLDTLASSLKGIEVARRDLFMPSPSTANSLMTCKRVSDALGLAKSLQSNVEIILKDIDDTVLPLLSPQDPTRAEAKGLYGRAEALLRKVRNDVTSLTHHEIRMKKHLARGGDIPE